MNQVSRVPSVAVRVPGTEEVQGNRLEIPQVTYLFRRDAYLSEALRTAAARAGDPSVLRIASIACSTGAEVDSLLALYNDSDAEGRVAITGFDASPPVIEEAEKGVYTLKEPQFDLLTPSMAANALRAMGFDVSPVPYESGEFQFAHVKADAAPVRAGHDVRFVEHDALEPLPGVQDVDLALANNILYHVAEDKAVRIARNMADVLTDRGVLSFGTGLLGPKVISPVADMLEEEFDLRRLEIDGNGPEMYARV